MSAAVTDPGRHLAAALAEALARPLGTFDPSHLQLGSFPGAALVRAAEAPHFGAALNRAVSRQLGLAALPLGGDLLERLASSPRARLAALLVTQPLGAVASAALLLAAALLHRPIVGVVLGTERARLRAALGEAAFEVATREALLLHAPLVAPPRTEVLGDLSDEAALREGLVLRGARFLREAADLAEPALGGLFVRRFPPGALDGAQGGAPLRPLTEERLDHALKLLRRRMPAWAASIA